VFWLTQNGLGTGYDYGQCTANFEMRPAEDLLSNLQVNLLHVKKCMA